MNYDELQAFYNSGPSQTGPLPTQAAADAFHKAIEAGMLKAVNLPSQFIPAQQPVLTPKTMEDMLLKAVQQAAVNRAQMAARASQAYPVETAEPEPVFQDADEEEDPDAPCPAPLKCPLCNSDAVLDKFSATMILVKCGNNHCGCRTAPFGTDKLAVRSWNMRWKEKPAVSVHPANLQASLAKIAGSEFDQVLDRVAALKATMDADVAQICDLVRRNPDVFNAKPGDNVLAAAAKFLDRHCHAMRVAKAGPGGKQTFTALEKLQQMANWKPPLTPEQMTVRSDFQQWAKEQAQEPPF